MGFVFFDTETTGLRHGFDQIVHFAAIRTDNDLNEVDRFEARSRLLPHVVPHPSALLTNGLPIERLTDEGLPSHYQMVLLIREKLLCWSPSIFVGYNSIRFDEEMLRHAFFQTLQPAYLTSSHGNSRADVLGLVMAAAGLSPASLSVPYGPEGRPIFRLEQLASANDVAHTDAHDAMGDVVATLGLCRRVHERSPELWHRFVRFSKKATVGDFVDTEDGFFLTEFFGNAPYHTPVVCIGADPDQPNGRFCLRLDVAREELAVMTEEAFQSYLSAKPSPVRRLRINAAPTLTAFYDAPDAMLDGADIDDLERRARSIKEDTALRSRIIEAFVATRARRSPSSHVEGRIYEGFPGRDDEDRMAKFHTVGWGEAAAIVQEFDDERLRVFGRRLIYYGGRSALSDDVKLGVECDLTDRLIDHAAGGFTLRQALDETERLLAENGADANGILSSYREYLTHRIKRVTEFRARRFVVEPR
ncbi:Exodeoxyribonuclease I subunit C [Roseomonas rosea]|uniref:Exodeoxyribonuclease I subunit C n=2 Tax=Roseomonadaceae TaxID=3385906 RepID=A0A1M6J809_9PROT|nr:MULTISPECIES: exonuclease domain-containing protein [Acetobacteraceae]PHK94707.1 exodeoxyribonuclease I [Pseudoroseomonas rhizosphaerae]SHJ42839.1 Exodeoxyribonuclease I subunit C [Roseomonas rosea]